MILLKFLIYFAIGYLIYQAIGVLSHWVKRLMTPAGPPIRDLSGMASDGDGDAGLKARTVNIGGPLKPDHLRLAVRDTRLLPKPKPPANQWPRPKKQRYMSEAEADRLFSPTMRTRNRDVRDLATDERQIARYGLPLWRNEEALAVALGLTLKQLQHLATHRIRETSPHYIAFAIPKRNGTQRIIHAPKRGLKRVQRRLNELLVSKLPVSGHAHGFRVGRSVASNAMPHQGKAVVIKFDIKDCFPTIHYGRIRGLLIALGYSYPVACSLAVLMTESPRQPVQAENHLYHVPTGPRVCVQGAPTSPGLCNAVLRRLDQRMAGLAASHGYIFTRYADDLTFSGDDPAKIGDLRKAVEKIAAAEGFPLNPDKTRIMRKGRRQQVTGVVVNEVSGLSRQERRKLRAAIHQLGRKPADEAAAERARLTGKIAYLHMLNKQQAGPLLRQLETVSQARVPSPPMLDSGI